MLMERENAAHNIAEGSRPKVATVMLNVQRLLGSPTEDVWASHNRFQPTFTQDLGGNPVVNGNSEHDGCIPSSERRSEAASPSMGVAAAHRGLHQGQGDSSATSRGVHGPAGATSGDDIVLQCNSTAIDAPLSTGNANLVAMGHRAEAAMGHRAEAAMGHRAEAAGRGSRHPHTETQEKQQAQRHPTQPEGDIRRGNRDEEGSTGEGELADIWSQGMCRQGHDKVRGRNSAGDHWHRGSQGFSGNGGANNKTPNPQGVLVTASPLTQGQQAEDSESSDEHEFYDSEHIEVDIPGGLLAIGEASAMLAIEDRPDRATNSRSAQINPR